jgi:hypothetical protein
MTDQFTQLKKKLWEDGKSAGNLPKDWIVIPVLDVIKMLESEEGVK